MGNASNLETEVRTAFCWQIFCRSQDPVGSKAAFRKEIKKVEIGEEISGLGKYECYLFYLPTPCAVGGWCGSENIKRFKRVSRDIAEVSTGRSQDENDIGVIYRFELSDENKDDTYFIGV